MNNDQPERLTNDQLKNLIRRTISENYNIVAFDIMEMVNDQVKSMFGYDPKVTEPMIRAHKYWYRVTVLENCKTA